MSIGRMSVTECSSTTPGQRRRRRRRDARHRVGELSGRQGPGQTGAEAAAGSDALPARWPGAYLPEPYVFKKSDGGGGVHTYI